VHKKPDHRESQEDMTSRHVKDSPGDQPTYQEDDEQYEKNEIPYQVHIPSSCRT
jgi:hypothetical protein